MLTSNDKSRFFVAEEYIKASKNLIEGMLSSGNPYVIISDHEISSDELSEGLKNSSCSIILPTLFCLYQGIELILKGFIIAKCDNISRHEAELLCEQFSVLYKAENELNALFNKFVFSPKEFIKEYMQLNTIDNISEFYNSLRYPDKKEEVDKVAHYKYRNYAPLMYPTHESFLPQIKELNFEIAQLLILSVKLFRVLEDTP